MNEWSISPRGYYRYTIAEQTHHQNNKQNKTYKAMYHAAPHRVRTHGPTDPWSSDVIMVPDSPNWFVLDPMIVGKLQHKHEPLGDLFLS